MAAHRRSAPPAGQPSPAGRRWLRLVDGGTVRRTRWRRQGPPTARRVVVRFVVANASAAALLLGGSLWAGYEVARAEALNDARSTAGMLAALWLEPNLTDDVVAGDPAALAHLDAVVAPPLHELWASRIKIWNSDGRIVYSDEPRLVGRTFTLAAEDQALLRDGGASAEFTDLSRPENRLEQPEDRMVEVYQQVTSVSGQPLLLELYLSYDTVVRRETATWLRTVPISASALALLVLVQLPLARRMVRQIRQTDRERLILHGRAADASSDERRRIAGALHDGVVQDLTAAAMLMGGRLERLRTTPRAEREAAATTEDLAAATGAVREAISCLRSLLVQIYPPHKSRAGLSATLADLARRLEEDGVRTDVDVEVSADLPPETVALVFRIVQEAVQNIARHARAEVARIAVRQDERTLTVEIEDDGVGFDPLADAPAGHFGMQVIADLTEEAGGTLDLASAPGQGTSVRLQVPVRRRDLVDSTG